MNKKGPQFAALFWLISQSALHLPHRQRPFQVLEQALDRLTPHLDAAGDNQ
ncbi:hypothetical protein ACFQ45_07225 [Rhodanobacter aciditrophus]|uniref:Uncharacterized protein n=1 Tax=Rhodanobacter aciditrophus TaxID=1623218 RepID=A0ABW4AZC6_9GAMM